MFLRKSSFFKGICLASLLLVSVGCTPIDDTSKTPSGETPSGETPVSEETEAEVLEWSIQPELGIIKGDYYKVEERFRQGHLGVLEIVKNEDRIVHVEFNEMTRPNYYHRYFQNVPKRMSEYNFDMGAKKGAAWIQSVILVEKQMKEEQRISGEFDVVSGASNSINQSMLPLALKIEPALNESSGQKYYSIAEELEGGLTGSLKVVLDEGVITSVRYDEIFADSKEDIEDEKLKEYYRMSKYDSVEYVEPSRIGFNVQMDALNEKVVYTQNLLDLSELPAVDESGNYASSGFTIRNGAWDNYLKLANTLLEELQKDGYLN